MANEPKKYSETQIREIYKKKSYPYKVSLLQLSLKYAIRDKGILKEEIYYLAKAMGYLYVDGYSEPKWIASEKPDLNG